MKNVYQIDVTPTETKKSVTVRHSSDSVNKIFVKSESRFPNGKFDSDCSVDVVCIEGYLKDHYRYIDSEYSGTPYYTLNGMNVKLSDLMDKIKDIYKSTKSPSDNIFGY